jgi:alpha-1,6-mannosyltransferase
MIKYVLVVISIAGFIFLSFFIERHQHIPLLAVFSLLFIIYLYQLNNLSDYRTQEIFNLGLLLRMVVFLALPALSDDFYRFIWDGRLLSSGNNPFEFLPIEFLRQDIAANINAELFYRLNSPEYFTVYPPLVQFIFLTATSLFPNDIYESVLVMKLFSFAAEAGLLLVMMRILRRLNISMRYIAVYALNPLVIIEGVGSLHHEGIMLFFLFLAIYMLMKSKYISSAVLWGMAVATKLLPLIYLPLLLRRMGKKKLLHYFLVLTFIISLLFLPFLEGLISGMGESISLYFQKFEFNASIYYIIREIGFMVKGYNIIQTAGPYLALTVFVFVMIYSLKTSGEEDLFSAMTWVFVIYLSLSTTVHPWYIISLIGFSVFTGYLFPLIWSLLIFFTYAGYHQTGYDEPGAIVIIEYAVVYALMFYEIFRKDSKPLLYRFIKIKTEIRTT